ncbi:hypothetical protein C8J57DRAFT_1709666 [Mycena rebaudengoi]|nr:hypothetical protein C8J57DRAFT_1709666 [Mycena rebaudengoi]
MASTSHDSGMDGDGKMKTAVGLSPANLKMLTKAKSVFLQHLSEVDTTNGPVDNVIIKFHLTPSMVNTLDSFVQEHGCTMSTRIISREEQDKIDARRKNCAQYTSVVVTPDAQLAYRGNKKISGSKRPSNSGSPKAPAKMAARKSTTVRSPRTPKSKSKLAQPQKVSPELDEVGDSDSESDSERPVMLSIPKAKFDSYCTRLADVLLLLPTVDLERGKECRDALVEVAHEMREFSAPKRRLDQVDEAEEKEPHSGKKVKKSRV